MKHLTPLALVNTMGIIALLLFVLGIWLFIILYTALGIISMILSACLLQYATWFAKKNS